MTAPIVPPPSIVPGVVQAIANVRLINAIRDGVVDFLVGEAKDLGKKELSDRIARLRSDGELREQIRVAIERAVTHWADDCPDRELVLAVAKDTTFSDLPSVQTAIVTIAKRPFDRIAADTLQGKFAEVLPQRFEIERVERGVHSFLEFLREEFASVPALRDAIAVGAEIQTARATRLSAETLVQIEALLKRLESKPAPTEKTLHDYLLSVIDQHRYLDPRGTMQTVRQVQVLLQDIYVSLEAEAEASLSVADRRLFEHEMTEVLQREDLSQEEQEDVRENLQARFVTDEPRHSAQPVELSALVRERAKLVILGDPGAGKTTLLRYLALLHAQAMRAGETVLNEYGYVRLPLYLRIANYAENHAGRALADFLPVCIRGEQGVDDTLKDLVRQRLADGTCLILLDGLDEVIEPSQRAEIAEQIDAVIRAYERAGNHFVVTSRVAGYRTASLSGDIAHYRVCDMNDGQIRRFLDLWCNAVERFQTPEASPQMQTQKAQAEIDSITQAIEVNPGVKRLATNPLLLRTLALIHRTGARLPQRRIELYRLAADTLIRDWELARGIPQTALVSESEATRLLSELAAWMHQQKPAGIATEGEVRDRLTLVKGALMGKDPDHPDVQEAVSGFLSRIRQHTGLFVERAPRRYGFMHLTFEEYFAARWLVAKPREVAKRIRQRLHRPRWEEPILLAIGFYGTDYPDAVSELVEEAILGRNLSGPSPYEDILHRDLFFAVRCLSDQDVDVGLRFQLIDQFLNVWLNHASPGILDPIEERARRVMNMLADSSAKLTLTERLLNALQDTNETVRGKVGSALSDLINQSDVVIALLDALQDTREAVRISAVGALRGAVSRPEVVTALLDALRDTNEIVRISAVSALSDVASRPEVVTALLDLLRDTSEAVHSSAVSALSGAASRPEVVTALLDALQDTRVAVRSSAARALRGATSRPEVVTALLDALQDTSEAVRNSALSVLSGVTSRPEVVTALLDLLRGTSETMRRSAAGALRGATSRPEVVTALLDALQDTSEAVRNNAVGALRGATSRPEVVTALLDLLRDTRETVRSSAVDALSGATSRPEVVTALLELLRDTSEIVRISAVSALSDAASRPEVVTALLDLLRGTSETVRSSAVFASMASLGQPEVVRALLDALQDTSETVRSSAAFALMASSGQPEVVTALLNALRDTSETVRGRAAYAVSLLAQKPTVRSIQDFSERLVATLNLPGPDKTTGFPLAPRDSLIRALLAVAPGPSVP